MPDPRPIRWYVDIDGPVNAPHPDPAWGEVRRADVRYGAGPEVSKFVWAPALITAIDAVASDLDIELVLLSQWAADSKAAEGMSEALGGLYGLRLAEYTHEDGSGLWKAEALITDQKSDPKPFIWTDDVEVQAHGRIVREATAGTPSLLISPSAIRGLTPAHLTTIRDFAATRPFNPLANNRIEPHPPQ